MEDVNYKKELVRSQLFILLSLLLILALSVVGIIEESKPPVILFNGLVGVASLLGIVRAVAIIRHLLEASESEYLVWHDYNDLEEEQSFVRYATQIYVGNQLIYQSQFRFVSQEEADILGGYLISTRFRWATVATPHSVLRLKPKEAEYERETVQGYIDNTLPYEIELAESTYNVNQTLSSMFHDQDETVTKAALLTQVKMLTEENKGLSECIEVLMGHDA